MKTDELRGAINDETFDHFVNRVFDMCNRGKERWLREDLQKFAENNCESQLSQLQGQRDRLVEALKSDAALVDRLAELEHERWTRQAIAALTDMTDSRRERWIRQARTLYAGLSEYEKEQDRAQVRCTLEIIASYLAALSNSSQPSQETK